MHIHVCFETRGDRQRRAIQHVGLVNVGSMCKKLGNDFLARSGCSRYNGGSHERRPSIACDAVPNPTLNGGSIAAGATATTQHSLFRGACFSVANEAANTLEVATTSRNNELRGNNLRTASRSNE
jgi:hypothetical protein